MQPIAVLRMSGFHGVDQQFVTAGVSGIIPDRQRGYSTALAIGSIVDGTFALYAPGAITELYHDETLDKIHLKITGSTNTGWTTMTILGQGAFLRASAAFAANEWVWSAAGGNPFGGVGTVRTVQWS